MTTTESIQASLAQLRERAEAREARQRGIDHARSEARLEGQDISPEAEPLFARYVEGELTREELRRQLIELYAGR